MVQLAIDADVCIGSGQCEMIEPETFIVDDETVVLRDGDLRSGYCPA